MKNVNETAIILEQSGSFAIKSNDSLAEPSREQVNAIRAFVEIVERRAEEKMLKTGLLEGAHYAAMKQVLREIQVTVSNQEKPEKQAESPQE